MNQTLRAADVRQGLAKLRRKTRSLQANLRARHSYNAPAWAGCFELSGGSYLGSIAGGLPPSLTRSLSAGFLVRG